MLLSVGHVARLMSVPEATVRSWIRREGLPAHRVQGRVALQSALLFDWAAARRLPLPASHFQQGGRWALVEALDLGGVHRAVDGFEEVARLLSAKVRRPCDREMVRAVIAGRSLSAYTLAADGVAVPSMSAPALVPGPPVVALIVLSSPLQSDGAPVNALFAALAPTLAAHRALVAELVEALGQSAVAEAARAGALAPLRASVGAR
ncbi:MAG: helix-turn-helix domain-containing protein [Deltaproteobacteria bacterium]|nr:helix-turn-helix domain-containing protein [Deltaproteobacteria bacterium]